MSDSTGDNEGVEKTVRKKRWPFVALIAAGFLLGLGLGWLLINVSTAPAADAPDTFNGGAIPSPAAAFDFSMAAHTGERMRLSDFRGKVVLLYFGYTYCPDICPATIAQLATARRELLDEEREEVQVIMITVDPARDTKEVLSDYLAHFDVSFLGFRGTEEELSKTAAAYGVYYEKDEGTSRDDYLMNHTATVFAIDKDGLLRLLYPFNTPGKDIASDLSKLVKE